jgi:hypothetical protein
MSLRDLVYTISPSWLRATVGSRLMYAMTIPFDALEDLAAYAVRARFPDLAPTDAWPYIELDRQIMRGTWELAPAWLARCRQWLDRWAHAGSPWGLLMGARACLSPYLCPVSLVTSIGTWDGYLLSQQDGPTVEPIHSTTAANWNWDEYSWPWINQNGAWNRAWLIIWPVGTPWTQSTQTWGDGSTWDAGELWDIAGGTAAQFTQLLAAVTLWKSAFTWIPAVIITWNGTDFGNAGQGAQPDGHYGTWSKIVPGIYGRPTRVASRYAGAAYLAGVT